MNQRHILIESTNSSPAALSGIYHNSSPYSPSINVATASAFSNLLWQIMVFFIIRCIPYSTGGLIVNHIPNFSACITIILLSSTFSPVLIYNNINLCTILVFRSKSSYFLVFHLVLHSSNLFSANKAAQMSPLTNTAPNDYIYFHNGEH
jgi:hypothetical protein